MKQSKNLKLSKKSIKSKLIILPLTIVFIAVASIALISSYLLRQSLMEQMKLEGFEYVKEVSQQLDTNYKSVAILNQQIEKEILNVGNVVITAQENISNDLLTSLAKDLGVDEINYYNNNGTIIYSNQEGNLNWTAPGTHPAGKFSKESSKSFMEKIRKSATDDNYYKYGYIRSPKGGFIQIGMLANTITELRDKFSYQNAMERLGNNKQIVYALFIDKNLKAAAHSDRDRINKNLDDEGSKSAAIDGKPYSSEFFYEPAQTLVYDIIAPLYINGEHIGAIDIGLSMDNVKNSIKKNMYYISLLSFVSFALLAFILYFIGNSISKTVQKMTYSFKELASGKLNVKLDIKSHDEMGVLASDFNSFSEKLSVIINQIINMTSDVVNVNNLINKSMDNLINGDKSSYYTDLQTSIPKGIIQLNKSIEDVLDNVRNQTASSEESLAALEEISATSDNINNTIKVTTDAFNETLVIAENSANDMDKMAVSMEEITESTKATGEEIEKLKDLSLNIGTITTSINSIAEQTNLLALNAAIEAARAGEAGRGFSVVADEIRKLAEQTNNETKKIEELIGNIQNEVEIVRQSSDEVKDKVITGLELSKISKENMSKIINNNNKNADQIKEISISIDEQANASREITSAIGSIADSSTEIEALSTDTTEISNNVQESIMSNQELLSTLEELVDQLKKDLEFFKL